MRRVFWTSFVMTAAVAALFISGLAARPDDRTELLKSREAVWRAWFVNDTKILEALVPADIFQSAAKFHAAGGKLIRLEFPRTEVRRFGDVAITYSQYLYETEVEGKRSVTSGRVTEIFVLRNGKWTNPGWHTDTEK
jgi:hypothetical protein